MPTKLCRKFEPATHSEAWISLVKCRVTGAAMGQLLHKVVTQSIGEVLRLTRKCTLAYVWYGG
jgi:hypothetical protein